jgi:hypothetical protein
VGPSRYLEDYIGESTTRLRRTEEAISLDVLSYLAGAFPGEEISVDIAFADAIARAP